MVEIKDSVEVSEVEQKIFDELLDAVRQAGLGTTLRCAGGWVRDKLMGRQSLDIDIALDNMLGKDFAQKVNDHLQAKGEQTHRVAVIMSNPEQSKHLETARLKINEVWVDLVNLRSEEYAHHSRIPTMEYGTPEQDAFRRDFTINALFYNLNEGVVEDFTGRGLTDLRGGVIRTPLPPKETFLDDPLRVLRAVRFASRFNFDLEESLLAAAQDPEVREMLGHKVSRERIGAELDGMLRGPDPVAAVEILHRLHLFEAVFEVHPSATVDVTEQFAAAGSALLAATHALASEWSAAPEAKSDEERQMLLAALLLPLRSIRITSVKGKPQSMASHIVRDSLKWKAKDADAVDALHATAPKLLEVHRELQAAGEGPEAAPENVKVKLGRCIRDLKGIWVAGTVLASLVPAKEAQPLGVESVGTEGGTCTSSPELEGAVSGTHNGGEAAGEGLAARLEVCKSLVAAAEAFGIADCWQWKPPMDGKAVMAAVGMTKGGPELGKLMDMVVDWQLVHPGGSQEECTAWLKENAGGVLEAHAPAKEMEISSGGDASGKISKSIASAQPGDIITIPGGRYRERLVLDKPIQLQPLPGQQVEVFWETDKPYESTIVCSADGIVIKGLTVRHSSPSIANNYAVQVLDCKARLEGCDVSSATGSGVGVEGSFAEVVDCSVHDCQRNGVMVFANLSNEGAGVVVKGCRIERNKLDGVVVTDFAAPEVSDNVIAGNSGYGLGLHGCGGSFRSNQLSSNRRGSVAYFLLDGIAPADLAKDNGIEESQVVEVLS